MGKKKSEEQYAPLDKQTFYEVFKESLNLGGTDSFRFITKAYYENDNVVSLYDNENEVDCYFQLPFYKTGLVPHERRYIYFLPANTLSKVSKSNSPDGRNNIDVNVLSIIGDPYNYNNNDDNDKENKEIGDSKLPFRKKASETVNNNMDTTMVSEDISVPDLSGVYKQISSLDKLSVVKIINHCCSELLTKI